MGGQASLTADWHFDMLLTISSSHLPAISSISSDPCVGIATIIWFITLLPLSARFIPLVGMLRGCRLEGEGGAVVYNKIIEE